MLENPGFTLETLKQYLHTPSERRPFASYQETRLDTHCAFTPGEASRLIEITHLKRQEYPISRVNKLLIDLSWASSRLEGSTYTQIDTKALIEYGSRNADKPAEDAAMILNHKKAIEFMLANRSLSPSTIASIHGLLADNTLAPDSRHFLPPEQCGVIRAYTQGGLEIDGSSYLPAQAEDRPPHFIDHEFERLLQSATSIPDPVNQSFFIMTRLPYLQAFYDANKRTSRIACNIPLISAGLSPLSFVDFEKADYISGLLAFYELGDERLAKTAFLDAYLASAFRYLPFGEKERASLAVDQQKHLAEARKYVVEGARELDPVWLRTLKPPRVTTPDESTPQ